MQHIIVKGCAERNFTQVSREEGRPFPMLSLAYQTKIFLDLWQIIKPLNHDRNKLTTYVLMNCAESSITYHADQLVMRI